MKQKFTQEQQKAIEEKIEQLQKIIDRTLSPQGLADLITKRRVEWIRKNRKEMLAKYDKLNPEEQTYRILCFDHMRINPEHIKMTRISPTKIRIDSYNPCPYLEACNQLDLDTRFVCKKIGEPSVQRFCEIINPDIKFSRNYQNLRPHTPFCEEYFEVLK